MRFPHTVRVESVTVKVYLTRKTDGYKSYWLAWYQSGRRMRATFADSKEALQRAQQIAEDLSRGKPKTASLSAEEAEVYLNAIETIRETGKSLSTVVHEYMDRYWDRQITRRKVKEVIDAYRILSSHYHEIGASLDDAKRWFATYPEITQETHDAFPAIAKPGDESPPPLDLEEEAMLYPFFPKRD